MSQYFLGSDIFPWLKRASVKAQNLLSGGEIPYEPLDDVVGQALLREAAAPEAVGAAGPDQISAVEAGVLEGVVRGGRSPV